MLQLREFTVWLRRFIPENACDQPWIHSLILTNHDEGQVSDKRAFYVEERQSSEGLYVFTRTFYITVSLYSLSQCSQNRDTICT